MQVGRWLLGKAEATRTLSKVIRDTDCLCGPFLLLPFLPPLFPSLLVAVPSSLAASCPSSLHGCARQFPSLQAARFRFLFPWVALMLLQPGQSGVGAAGQSCAHTLSPERPAAPLSQKQAARSPSLPVPTGISPFLESSLACPKLLSPWILHPLPTAWMLHEQETRSVGA